ncbi:MAG: methyltransferase domain-containing protein [Sphingobium sp.]|nr:methyltransferase domain-containing protein [Sphingobium sp.]MBP6112453.1 methyltransferase domain-containing protein [Sphingobium sp.]MBP8671019.1 methyltransferase domain-containing protein [Sphingobium sp.]MBP9158143.1 methyltransferase domain-containing protein [Sphingobium sp.]MCC6481200.1 methyltransferase domain-containing protein [Sphingomonadaceae bacterium]
MTPRSKPARSIALLKRVDIGETARENVEFFMGWLRKPRQTAAIVPSSRFLARQMVTGIDPEGGRVLELGGGTGAFTRAILATGLPPEKLEVAEINPLFASGLERQFPEVSILRQRAEQISAYVAGEEGGYQCVVSGLPMLAFSQQTHKAILQDAFRLLMPGGIFVQFTYSALSPVGRPVLDALGLEATPAGRVLLNIPPATVFHFQRNDGDRT